jgi:hypothetical protein
MTILNLFPKETSGYDHCNLGNDKCMQKFCNLIVKFIHSKDINLSCTTRGPLAIFSAVCHTYYHKCLVHPVGFFMYTTELLVMGILTFTCFLFT